MFFTQKNYTMKILTIITDGNSKRWLDTLDGAGSRGTSSALAGKWDGWLVVVPSKQDTWTSVWAKVLEKRKAFPEASHTVAFSPSHGSSDGKKLLWSPCVGLNGPVKECLLMALQNGYEAAHLHSCCAGKHIKNFKVEKGEMHHLRVTSFDGTLWTSFSANDADKWLARGLHHRLAPIGDGWIFYLTKKGDALALTREPRLLGKKRKRNDGWVLNPELWKKPGD